MFLRRNILSLASHWDAGSRGNRGEVIDQVAGNKTLT
jgi:hypothetical protein